MNIRLDKRYTTTSNSNPTHQPLTETSFVSKHVRQSPPAPPPAQPSPDPEATLIEGRIVPVHIGLGLGRAVC